jgi:recombination protein RecA
MGLHARLMSQAMRKIVAKVERSNTIVIFTNQLRDRIGIMWGSPETTTGGNALKFYASIRLDVRGSSKILAKDGEEVIGNIVKIKAVKNKTSPPFRTTEMQLFYGTGYSKESDILTICLNLEIVKKSGSWFSYGETRLGQGQLNVLDLLRNNPDLVDELELKILESYVESK